MLLRYIDRNKTCCISIITRPSANSAAEKIKKKNVKDSILTLSNRKPTSKTMMYSDIHISSAVSSKCRAVLTLRTIVNAKQKNKIKTRFKSPNTIYLKFINKYYFFIFIYKSSL